MRTAGPELDDSAPGRRGVRCGSVLPGAVSIVYAAAFLFVHSDDGEGIVELRKNLQGFVSWWAMRDPGRFRTDANLALWARCKVSWN